MLWLVGVANIREAGGGVAVLSHSVSHSVLHSVLRCARGFCLMTLLASSFRPVLMPHAPFFFPPLLQHRPCTHRSKSHTPPSRTSYPDALHGRHCVLPLSALVQLLRFNTEMEASDFSELHGLEVFEDEGGVWSVAIAKVGGGWPYAVGCTG